MRRYYWGLGFYSIIGEKQLEIIEIHNQTSGPKTIFTLTPEMINKFCEKVEEH